MSWHEDLRLEIAVEFQRLSTANWALYEERLFRSILVGAVKWKAMPVWFWKTPAGRRVSRESSRRNTEMLQRTIVATRGCAHCGKPFGLTAYREAKGHGRTCSRTCASALSQRTSGNTVMVKIGKETRSLVEWCRARKLSYRCVRSRMMRGASVVEALATTAAPPIRVRLIEHAGVTQPIGRWAKSARLSTGALRYRLETGLSLADALALPTMRGGRGRCRLARRLSA